MRDWIAEVRARRTGNHADPARTTLLPAGPLAIGLEHRIHAGNVGYCLHVYGERAGLAHELLRIDCFDREPHYHRGWSLEDEIVWVEPATDPWAWGQALLAAQLPALAAPEAVDVAAVLAALEAARASA